MLPQLSNHTAALLTTTDLAMVNATSRAAGAVGARAITPRWVEEHALPTDRILDYGAGRDAIHSRRLRSQGLHVVSHDIGSNFVPGVHDPAALVPGRYSMVFSSNVLNVLPDYALIPVLREAFAVLEPSGRFVANLPLSPRKNSLTGQILSAQIASVFGRAPVRVGGTAQAPLFLVEK